MAQWLSDHPGAVAGAAAALVAIINEIIYLSPKFKANSLVQFILPFLQKAAGQPPQS